MFAGTCYLNRSAICFIWLRHRFCLAHRTFASNMCVAAPVLLYYMHKYRITTQCTIAGRLLRLYRTKDDAHHGVRDVNHSVVRQHFLRKNRASPTQTKRTEARRPLPKNTVYSSACRKNRTASSAWGSKGPTKNRIKSNMKKIWARVAREHDI